MSEPGYQGFLGLWILQPASCDYEQGEPPQSGSYRIDEREGQLHFIMDWVDSKGEHHHVEFSGIPDGSRQPFAGGELADELSVTLVSARELNSSAYYRGKERMVAQRQLDDTSTAMRVVQMVRLPDGSKVINTSLYLRPQ